MLVRSIDHHDTAPPSLSESLTLKQTFQRAQAVIPGAKRVHSAGVARWVTALVGISLERFRGDKRESEANTAPYGILKPYGLSLTLVVPASGGDSACSDGKA